MYENTLLTFVCKATKNNDTTYQKSQKLSVDTENHPLADHTEESSSTEKGHEKNHTPNEGNVVFRILMIKSKSDSEIKPQLVLQQFQQLELQEQQPLPLVQKTCENGE